MICWRRLSISEVTASETIRGGPDACGGSMNDGQALPKVPSGASDLFERLVGNIACVVQGNDEAIRSCSHLPRRRRSSLD